MNIEELIKKHNRLLIDEEKKLLIENRPETATKRKNSSRDYRHESDQSFKRLKNTTIRNSNSPAEHYSPETKAAVTLKKESREVLKLRLKQVYGKKKQ